MPSKPKQEGDYTDTTAFKLARHVGKAPLDVAQQLAKCLEDQATASPKKAGKDGNREQPISSVSVSKKGFINIHVSDDWLKDRVASIVSNTPAAAESYKLTPKRRVVVDFASPNVGKQLHAGHLRSSVIGDSIARLLEHQGHDVIRFSHVGDLGLPVALLISHGLDKGLPWLQDDKVDLPKVEELSKLYVEAKERYSHSIENSNEYSMLVANTLNILQGSDKSDGPYVMDNSHTYDVPTVLLAWERVKEVSRHEQNRIFSRLSVNVEERPESSYRHKLDEIVEELSSKGIATVSDGATCIFPANIGKSQEQTSDKEVARRPQIKKGRGKKLKEEKSEHKNHPPMIIKKSDGAFLYATVDLAAAKERLEVLGADWLVYVTDEGQSLHFQQVFEAIERAGWGRNAFATQCKATTTPKLDHVGFGVVRAPGSEGKGKLSSRDGNALGLEALIDEACARANGALRVEDSMIEDHRFSHGHKEDKSDDLAQKVASIMLSEAVGISALRFFDLKSGQKSYELDFDKMLAFRGYTSVYLQYALTRARSIRRKAEDGIKGSKTDSREENRPTGRFATDVERDLALLLARFDDILELAARKLSPHILCEFLFELAQKFHSFYEECPVSGSVHFDERIQLLLACERVFEDGMYILGVVPLDRM